MRKQISLRSRATSDAALAVIRTLTLSALFLFGACTDNPVAPDAGPPVSSANGAGQLIVRSSGLPSGTSGTALIRGPQGFIQRVATGDTLRGLPAGDYTVIAPPIATSQGTFEPEEAEQAVTIVPGKPQAVVFNFDLFMRSGTIIVDVAGLPAGVASDIAASLSGTTRYTITASQTLSSVTLGEWTFTARPVQAGGTTWVPVPATQVRALRARETVRVGVRYHQATGSLAIAVVGLPSGSSGNVSVSGPAGYSQSISATTTLTDLAVGQYTVSAASVTVGGVTYSPSPASHAVEVVAGDVAAGATVSYAAQAAPTGSLKLTLSGLPTGQSGQLVVSGPNDFSRVVTASTTLTGLTPGSYSVNASSVRTSSGTFGVSPSSSVVTVQSGQTAQSNFSYTALPAVVRVTVSGLPGGASASASLISPSGSSSSVTGSTTLSPAATGRWRLNASSVTVAGNKYTPTPASYDQSVLAGDTLDFPVTYALSTGSLAVSVTGLPAGASGSVSVTGPGGYSKSLTATETLTSLTPGSYTVAASAVTVSGVSYSASPATRTVTVSASLVAASAAVTYAAQSGKLALTVSGLPSGAAADIVVTGPGGYSENVTATTTLEGLPVGTYNVASNAVQTAQGRYTSSPATRSVSITAGATKSETVTYTALPAVVRVTVSGLPGGASASASLISPSGSSSSVTGSTTLSPAATGRWRLNASSVTVAGNKYTPTPASYDQSVLAGDTLDFPVTYALSTGSLAVSVTGLPAGASGSVSVTGPGGYSKSLTATETLTSLTPGSYTVAASAVTVSGVSYSASPATRTVTVSASLVAASAAVTYAAQSGKLALTVSGLPSGAAADIVVTGPGGYSENVTATTTLEGLPVGTYNVTSNAVQTAQGRYTSSPATRSVSITAGATKSETITYALSTGSLAVSVTGLPAGASGSVSVTGPGGYSKSLTATETLTSLTPGSYTVAASAVTVSGVSYSASPATRTVTVSASLVAASAAVTYAAQGGGDGGGSGGGSEVPNLSIENVYVTQATQNWEGTAPIVVGRDALARVFVKAAASNTAKPAVRLKIYQGASLISTVTIPASASSVPTSISEGSMSSSWNVVIPASNVRTGMQVLAELDPGNSLGETDRSDNAWPRGGSPKAVNTIDPPPLNIRFVPMNVAGRTGNINESNKESWLEMMKLIYPLREVNASVRAPFTSNAPALQSNDGNNAWGKVLGEVAALQRAEASPYRTHFFGVVNTSYSSGYAGFGEVPGWAAVGWDQPATYQRIFAHEIGHNFALPHAPCGVSGDNSFPYSGGKIGVWGWNASSNTLMSPTMTDVMGYCSNQWISDYNWQNVNYWRSFAGRTIAAARSDGMLIWGQDAGSGMEIEPAFPVFASATPEPGDATHIAELYDDLGGLVTTYRFRMERVDHGDRNQEHFAVVVPLTQQQQQMVARLSVRPLASPLPMASIRGSSTNRAMAVAGDAAVLIENRPASVVEPTNGGMTRVTWNERVFRMGMVRDRNTGEILSFLRHSGDRYVGGGRSVEIVFSDGTRAVRENH